MSLSVTRISDRTSGPARVGGKPNFSGIWQANNEAYWDLQAHAALPAAITQEGIYPYEITQSTNKIHMAFAYALTARTIHMDKVDGPPDDTWMGHSVGRWEGDTLVVDVTNFNDRTWFDRAGNFHSDALHLTERFTLQTPDVIRYEATIEDPKVFSRPWRIAMPLYRRMEPNAQLIEYRCSEFAEEFMYGHLRKTPLVKHWEGETMVDAACTFPSNGDSYVNHIQDVGHWRGDRDVCRRRPDAEFKDAGHLFN